MAKKNYGSGMGKSSAKAATGNNSGGNFGKPIGDRGTRSRQGNRKTRLPADRY